MRKNAVTRRLASSTVIPQKGSKRTPAEGLERSTLDREHLDLCVTLRQLLDDCVSDHHYLAGMKLLNHFFAQLMHHHETENEALRALEPRNWKTHIELHAELVSITSDILKKTTLNGYLDTASIEGLLVVLERHIDTLDAALFARFEAQ